MKSLDKIPTSKISRASKLVSTGAKVGVNYLNYYKDKITKTEKEARHKLNESNAEDIYDSLSNLKGSALKVAQMLSMEKSIMPQQYVEKFSLSQFSVPPLSAPLVRKTFQTYFDKTPEEIFDQFTAESVNAASIGQVHKAWKDGKELAVKIQYPGVAESISTDLKMVKPIAMRMFNIKGKDSDKYFKEVENKLLEETDYVLEVAQSREVATACAHIPNLKFPTYYPEWSSDRIITMDWMHGIHLSEFVAINENEELANRIGQALWDFYMYQIHQLKKVHADPHPGNFLISNDGDLIALDFGCMKMIPDNFYNPYFELVDPVILHDNQKFQEKMEILEILKPEDTPEEREFFREMFQQMIALFTKPLHFDTFDFSDENFFDEIYALGEKYSKDTKLRKMNGNRGSEHFIYMNRTFFGLYSLMHDLKSTRVKIQKFIPEKFIK
ncbi:AarF/ABC1/UbiB kinase family protein [Flavobacteriaceae bacterium Ap0902]|nr:AarF/ABC1/UbiB kinase family protein [Flavobacteriaceae bacterium Ap0902]